MASEATTLSSVPEGYSGGPGNAGRGGIVAMVIDPGAYEAICKPGRAALFGDKLRVRRRRLASPAASLGCSLDVSGSVEGTGHLSRNSLCCSLITRRSRRDNDSRLFCSLFPIHSLGTGFSPVVS